MTGHTMASTTAARSVRNRASRRAGVRIAHDFNNILMAIVGHCDLLERGVVDTSEAVREIRSAAESGARLARELLLAPGCPAAGSTTRRSE